MMSASFVWRMVWRLQLLCGSSSDDNRGASSFLVHKRGMPYTLTGDQLADSLSLGCAREKSSIRIQGYAHSLHAD